MTPLQAARNAVETGRKSPDPEALATAIVRLAELEPIFRYRTEPARSLLKEAAALLTGLDLPLLEGRCLLRLSEVQLAEGLVDQALLFTERARQKLAEQPADSDEDLLRAACLEVRIRFRQGQRPEAEKLLAETSARAATLSRKQARSSTLVALSLAVADGQIDAQDSAGIDTLRQLLQAVDRYKDEAVDGRFAAHQGIALLAQIGGHPEQAISHLRQAVALVRSVEAPLDLLECRLGLGTALAAAGKLPEARLALQTVVDQARELGQPEMRALGLTGLATVLSEQGAYRGGVERAIQSAVEYGNRGNLLGYVRGVTLATYILLSHQREALAIEMLMYGAAALRHTVGEEAARLLEVQLEALRTELGSERFEALCTELKQLRAARKRLETP